MGKLVDNAQAEIQRTCEAIDWAERELLDKIGNELVVLVQILRRFKINTPVKQVKALGMTQHSTPLAIQERSQSKDSAAQPEVDKSTTAVEGTPMAWREQDCYRKPQK